VRRLFLIAVLALGLAACGGAGSSNKAVKIAFGWTGGTMFPVSFTIAPSGAVTENSHPPVKATQLSSAEVVKLSGLVRAAFPGLKSEQCPGSFPDESSMYITALGKTVTVRGTCEPGFTKLFNELRGS
jgi:hypothetical protein